MDLSTCVSLAAAEAILFPFFATLMVRPLACVLLPPHLRNITIDFVTFFPGEMQGKFPLHMHCRLHITIVFLRGSHQPTRNPSFHKRDANKIKRGECVCPDESTWSKYHASQFFPPFCYCAGNSFSPCPYPPPPPPKALLCVSDSLSTLSISFCIMFRGFSGIAYLACC